MKAKKVSEARTEMSQLMMPHHANPAGTVYGGTILSIADSVAYVCAARHAGQNCVTAAVDAVNFRESIRIGEVVIFRASVNYVGKTSMEIGIKIFAEDLKTGKQRHANTCYFTLVYLGEKGLPTTVPKLIPETAAEKRRFREAKQRRRIAERSRKDLSPKK